MSNARNLGELLAADGEEYTWNEATTNWTEIT